jgi:hypothetical protein
MRARLLIDGMMSGTGIRDAINGGYVEIADLSLSDRLARDIRDWQAEYRIVHIEGHPSEKVVVLDEVGLALMARVQRELPEKTVGYYSDGQMKRLV